MSKQLIVTPDFAEQQPVNSAERDNCTCRALQLIENRKVLSAAAHFLVAECKRDLETDN